MKKLGCLNFFTAVLILSVAPLILFSGYAQAYVYDDFTGTGLDTSLWVDKGPNLGLFYQPGDGYLYFNDPSGGLDDRIRSYNQVSGAFSVVMRRSNFQAINNQPPGQMKSTFFGLVIGDGTNSVIMMEGKNSSGHFFQAQLNTSGTATPLTYFYTGDVNSAWLGIRFNGVLGSGGKVDFLYNFGAGWRVIDSCAPNFSQAPWFSIRGSDVYGQSLSFRVDQVQVTTPSPLPAIFLLLEPDS
jgi:hypothetical protein